MQHGANAGQHGAGAGPPGMAVGAGRFAGDPLALAVGQGGHTVYRGSCFEAHPGRAAQHAAEKPDVQFPCGRSPVAQSRVVAFAGNLHRHTGRVQARKALPRHQRVRVGQGGDHAADACVYQGIATRPGAPVVAAGLERHIGGGTSGAMAQRLGVAQGHHFRVRATGLLGAAFAYHLAGWVDQHAAHARVGVGPQQRGLCLLQRLRQVGLRGVPVCEGGLGGRHGQGQQPVLGERDAAWVTDRVVHPVSPVCAPMAAA